VNYFQQLHEWFQAIPHHRKMSLMSALLLIIISTSFLSWYALSPTYELLFNQLDEQDAAQIISQLDQNKIKYEVRNSGRDILIDKALVAKTRLKIMGSGLKLTGSVGFELFDKNDFGMTDFSQKINFQRALQGELERTIASFKEVRQARVHLVIPETHLFSHEDSQPKAAVTLQLKKELTANQIHSIQQLITASVSHLTAKNVVVVDHKGNTLSSDEEHDQMSNQFTAKKTIEQYLSLKVDHMLMRVFPENQMVVKIDATMNYDEVQRELINPQFKGMVTHEKQTTHATAGKTEKEKPIQDTTVEKSYQLGSKKELFKRAHGTIERLSISVILPIDTSEKTVAQIKRLVKTTVGFNEQRGDTISIEALIAPLKASTVPQAEPIKPQIINTPYNLIFTCFIGIISMISGATVILKRIKHKKRQQLLTELTQWLTHHE